MGWGWGFLFHLCKSTFLASDECSLLCPPQGGAQPGDTRCSPTDSCNIPTKKALNLRGSFPRRRLMRSSASLLGPTHAGLWSRWAGGSSKRAVCLGRSWLEVEMASCGKPKASSNSPGKTFAGSGAGGLLNISLKSGAKLERGFSLKSGAGRLQGFSLKSRAKLECFSPKSGAGRLRCLSITSGVGGLWPGWSKGHQVD